MVIIEATDYANPNPDLPHHLPFPAVFRFLAGIHTCGLVPRDRSSGTASGQRFDQVSSRPVLLPPFCPSPKQPMISRGCLSCLMTHAAAKQPNEVECHEQRAQQHLTGRHQLKGKDQSACVYPRELSIVRLTKQASSSFHF